MDVYIQGCATACVWRSEDNLVKWILSFRLYTGSGDGTQVITLLGQQVLFTVEPCQRLVRFCFLREEKVSDISSKQALNIILYKPQKPHDIHPVLSPLYMRKYSQRLVICPKSQGQSRETNSGHSISGCLHGLQLRALILSFSEFHPDHMGYVVEWQRPRAHHHHSHRHHSRGPSALQCFLWVRLCAGNGLCVYHGPSSQ